jgi:hypothetical protein
MRTLVALGLLAAGLPGAASALVADEYLNKDGKLAHELKLVQTQGGFAGSTGVRHIIASDGTWTSETIFNQKTTPKDKGTLSKDELEKLAAVLAKYDFAKLPAKSGKPPAANPHTIEFEFGKQKASLVSQTPPMLDPKKPTATVESRIAGVWEEIVELLTPPKEE